MSLRRILAAALLSAVFPCSLYAGIDYKPDTTFVSAIGPGDDVNDVLVLPDGKLLVAGEDSVVGQGTEPFVIRLNPSGAIDTSFNCPIHNGAGNQGHISTIEALPNGQFLITGYFYVGETLTHYARINSDGSIDATLTLSSQSSVRTAQPDGKLIACGGRGTSLVAYRLNADGSLDPTFQATWSDPGTFCNTVRILPDGKMLLAGNFASGGQPIKPLVRINSDGSLDPSFVAAIQPGELSGNPKVLEDGKIIVASTTTRRLNPDGSLDLAFPNCEGSFGAFDGPNYLIGNCKKWASGSSFFVSRVSPNGVVDVTFDNLSLIAGWRSAGNNTLYAYGNISTYGGHESSRIMRFIPNNAPPRARFDFDGDGRSDLAVYRPSDRVWYLYQSTDGIAYRQWGLPNDQIITGDANRDGRTDIGVYRDGAWHALTVTTNLHYYMCHGQAGDKAMVLQDYEGPGLVPGTDRYAVRGQRTGGLWWLVSSYTNCYVAPTQAPLSSVSGEQMGDISVAGDFNGDSRSEIGYFRDGVWYTADTGALTGPATLQWGTTGDIPVPGDYDGDRQTDYAIFRPSTGEWWIRRSTAGVLAAHFGMNGDIPVPADYDGDGKIDIAIFRDGVWWQFLSATGTVAAHQWGTTGDIPIPAQDQF